MKLFVKSVVCMARCKFRASAQHSKPFCASMAASWVTNRCKNANSWRFCMLLAKLPTRWSQCWTSRRFSTRNRPKFVLERSVIVWRACLSSGILKKCSFGLLFSIYCFMNLNVDWIMYLFSFQNIEIITQYSLIFLFYVVIAQNLWVCMHVFRCTLFHSIKLFFYKKMKKIHYTYQGHCLFYASKKIKSVAQQNRSSANSFVK